MTVLAGALAKTGEAAKSGPIGLAIILILCIACYFLFKSMSKHLKTVREDFPTPADSSDPTAPAVAPAESAAPKAAGTGTGTAGAGTAGAETVAPGTDADAPLP